MLLTSFSFPQCLISPVNILPGLKQFCEISREDMGQGETESLMGTWGDMDCGQGVRQGASMYIYRALYNLPLSTSWHTPTKYWRWLPFLRFALVGWRCSTPRETSPSRQCPSLPPAAANVSPLPAASSDSYNPTHLD